MDQKRGPYLNQLLKNMQENSSGQGHTGAGCSLFLINRNISTTLLTQSWDKWLSLSNTTSTGGDSHSLSH